MRLFFLFSFLLIFFCGNAEDYMITNVNSNGAGSLKSIIDSINSSNDNSNSIYVNAQLSGEINIENIDTIKGNLKFYGTQNVDYLHRADGNIVFLGSSVDLSFFNMPNAYQVNIYLENASKFQLSESLTMFGCFFQNVDSIIVSNSRTIGVSNTEGKYVIFNNHYDRGGNGYGLRLTDYENGASISLIDFRMAVQANNGMSYMTGNAVEIENIQNASIEIRGFVVGNLNTESIENTEEYGKAIKIQNVTGDITIAESDFTKKNGIFGSGSCKHNNIDIKDVPEGNILIQNNRFFSSFGFYGGKAKIYLENCHANTDINYNANYYEDAVDYAKGLSFDMSGIYAKNCSNINSKYNSWLDTKNGIVYEDVQNGLILGNYLGVFVPNNFNDTDTVMEIHRNGIHVINSDEITIRENFIASVGSHFIQIDNNPNGVVANRNFYGCAGSDTLLFLENNQDPGYQSLQAYFNSSSPHVTVSNNQLDRLLLPNLGLNGTVRLDVYKKSRCSDLSTNLLYSSYLDSIFTSNSSASLDLSNFNIGENENIFCAVSNSNGQLVYFSDTIRKIAFGDPQTLFVTNAYESGQGSLRAAIDAAESAISNDVIVFSDQLTDSIIVNETFNITDNVMFVQMSSGNNGTAHIHSNVSSGPLFNVTAPEFDLQYIKITRSDNNQFIRFSDNADVDIVYTDAAIDLDFENAWQVNIANCKTSNIDVDGSFEFRMEYSSSLYGKYMANIVNQLPNGIITFYLDSLGIMNRSSYSTDFGFGIRIDSSEHITVDISNNTMNGIESNINGYGNAAVFIKSFNADIEIRGNNFGYYNGHNYNGSFAGSGIHCLYNTGRTEISDNIFNTFAGNAIHLQHVNSPLIQLNHHTSFSNGLNGSNSVFIGLSNCNNGSIINNNIESSNIYGIQMNGCSNNKIINNHIGTRNREMTLDLGAGVAGLFIGPLSNGNIVKSNYFLYNKGYAIEDYSGENTLRVNYYACNDSGMIKTSNIDNLQSHHNNYPNEYIVQAGQNGDEIHLTNLPFPDGTKVDIYKTLDCSSFDPNEIESSYMDSVTVQGGEVVYTLPPLLESEDPAIQFELIFLDENNEILSFLEPIDYPETTQTIDLVSNKTFNIYPNPNTGEFHYQNDQASTITLYDINGKIVESRYTSDNEEVLISVDQPGLYFLKIKTFNEVEIIKIVSKQ